MKALLLIVIGFTAVAYALTMQTGVDTLYSLVAIIAIATGVDHYRSGTFAKPVEVEATEHSV